MSIKPVDQTEIAWSLSGLSKTPPYLFFLFLSLFAITFYGNVDLARSLRTSDSGNESSQAVVKFFFTCVAGLIGAWGWWRSPDVRKLLQTLPGILLMILSAIFFLTTVFSIVPKVSFAASISNLSAILFAATAMVYFGGKRSLFFAAGAMFLYVSLSCLMHLLHMDAAIFVEVMSAHLKVERLGGLGHPNTLGRISVVLALILLGFCLQKQLNWKYFAFASIPILYAIYYSQSRSPVLAGLFAVFFVLLPDFMRSRYRDLIVLVSISLIVLGMIGFFVLGSDKITDRIVGKLTKTGQLEEVTTMTGRTEIWKFAWEKAIQSPIVGYGAGSTPVLMVEKSSHAHNILLQPTVCIGFPGGIVFLILLGWNLYSIFVSEVMALRFCLLFTIVIGIAESPLFNPLPESMTMVWLICTFWPALHHNLGSNHVRAPDEQHKPKVLVFHRSYR